MWAPGGPERKKSARSAVVLSAVITGSRAFSFELDLCGDGLLKSGVRGEIAGAIAGACLVIFLGSGLPVFAVCELLLALRECCLPPVAVALYITLGSESGPVERMKSAKSLIEESLFSVGSRGAACLPLGDLGIGPSGLYDAVVFFGERLKSVMLEAPFEVGAWFERKPLRPFAFFGDADEGDVDWSVDLVRVLVAFSITSGL